MGWPRAKSRGRPQIRKIQVQPEKKQRVERAKQNVNKLVQGTLAPVPSVRNIASYWIETTTTKRRNERYPRFLHVLFRKQRRQLQVKRVLERRQICVPSGVCEESSGCNPKLR
ncbi:hypothetical protein PHMEG_0004196 [Phytophthora megakarya]|uniref:Uncharacterized protein n=1 Tax=Phytophthora megakarya TaxID=4795 RepID=A0A225WUG5_9STRA|nr:hypothetical protein PHMEG_0004196 [Phytophthora megakarya]